MATAEATREFTKDTKDLGDKIVGLTLKAAKELSDYLDEVHGIKPAAGGAVMMAAPGAGGAGGAAAFDGPRSIAMPWDLFAPSQVFLNGAGV